MNLLWSMFCEISNLFRDKECIIFYEESEQKTISYNYVYSLVENVSESIKSSFGRYFIGLLCYDVSPAVIVFILSIIKHDSGFVFIDSNANNAVKKKYGELKVPFVIVQEDTTLISHMKSVFQTLNCVTKFKLLNVNYELWQCNPKCSADDEELNYIFAVCTSGSTGIPKLVKVTSDSVMPNILYFKDKFGITENDVLYGTAPLTFDPSVVDIFTVLCSGASLLLCSKESKINSHQLYREMFLNGLSKVTVFSTTPSLFLRWNDYLIAQLNSTPLRILLLGGEPCPSFEIITRWNIMENVKIFNLYGITEVSCWASVCCINEITDGNIHLGAPFANTELQVRNEVGDILRSDGVGEVYIGSKSRICVVDNEAVDRARKNYFRATGDIVEVRQWKYYFVGRKNRIIKLYGNKIDLSRIEVISLKLSQVSHSCCFHLLEEQKIILMVQSNRKKSDNFENDQLILDLKKLLFEEHSMLPDDIVVVPNIPLNIHGKTSEADCMELYKIIKKQSANEYCKVDKENFFYFLWDKYAAVSTGTSILKNNNSGFSEFGNDSVRAIQFISELSDVYQPVSKQLITALLAGKSAKYCYSLLCKHSDNSVDIGAFGKEERHNEDSSTSKLHLSELPVNRETKNPKGKLMSWKCRGVEKQLLPPIAEPEYLENHTDLKLFWKHNLNKCIDSSPLFLLYGCEQMMVVVCGSHSGEFVTVDVASGTLISKCILPDRIESTPCASSDGYSVYIGCYDGCLYSIDLRTGRISWNFKTNDIVKSGPVLFDGHVYFGSYDHYLYCVTEIGELVWKRSIDDSSIYASVAVFSDTFLIVTTLKGTAAVCNFSGDVICTRKFGNPIFSNPLAMENLNGFCITDVCGTLYYCCMDKAEISVKWKFQTDGNIFSSLAIVKCSSAIDDLVKIVFGCYDNYVYCVSVSKESAKLNWKTDMQSAVYATPSVHDKYVVSVSTKGTLHVLNADDGNIVFSFKVDGEVFSSPLFHYGFIIFGCRNDNLYCLKSA